MFTITILTIIALVIFLSKNPKFKGKIGELKVHLRLLKLGSSYTIIDNLLIKNSNGHTTQIDHIVVSIYGIFVIETKNYKGWIFGNDKMEDWTQVIFTNKYYFRNPVKQNLGHINSLKQLLSEYSNIKYYPIVVFTNNAFLKNITSDVPVIYESSLSDIILKQSISKCLSLEEIADIQMILTKSNILTKENEEEHIKNVKKIKLERRLKSENLICPNCNIELKLRNGKYGKFYGCTNYPNCKFTMKY